MGGNISLRWHGRELITIFISHDRISNAAEKYSIRVDGGISPAVETDTMSIYQNTKPRKGLIDFLYIWDRRGTIGASYRTADSLHTGAAAQDRKFPAQEGVISRDYVS